MSDIVSPAARERPAIPVNGGRHRDDTVEFLAESLRHFMALTTAVGAADEIVPGVFLSVIDLRDALAPQVRMMLTSPAVIHDATVVDGVIGVQTERGSALARGSFDGRGRRVWV